MRIFVDADSCPVKDEVYRVAKRYGLEVTLVSATWLRIPPVSWIHLEVVKDTGGLDAADDWIATNAGAGAAYGGYAASGAATGGNARNNCRAGLNGQGC